MGKSSKLDREQLALETTVMAIREELMQYFKGGCVERVTADRNIQLVNLQDFAQHQEYSFLRRQLENQRPHMLLLGNAPILTLQSMPDTVIFHSRVLGRSPQFRAIRKQLDKFMDKYLQGVAKEENDAAVFYG